VLVPQQHRHDFLERLASLNGRFQVLPQIGIHGSLF